MLANAIISYDVQVEEVRHRLDISLWRGRVHCGVQLHRIEVRTNGCWDAHCQPIDDPSLGQGGGEESEEETEKQHDPIIDPDNTDYLQDIEKKITAEKFKRGGMRTSSSASSTSHEDHPTQIVTFSRPPTQKREVIMELPPHVSVAQCMEASGGRFHDHDLRIVQQAIPTSALERPRQ